MIKLLVIAAIFVGSYVAANPIDANAETRSFNNEQKPDDSYSYQFDTTNGIAVQESGIGGLIASGSSQHYSPEGELIQLTYTADENGFHPQGDHLPTPPPVPDHILRALEYIRSHPPHEDNHHEKQHHQHQEHHQQEQYYPQNPHKSYRG